MPAIVWVNAGYISTLKEEEEEETNDKSFCLFMSYIVRKQILYMIMRW